MEASNTPTWEACKENVLPIKRGRSAKGLSESLQKNNEDLSENNSRDKTFEDSIIAAAKSSPKNLLDAYSLYFKWTRDTYPTNTEKALKLLEVFYLKYPLSLSSYFQFKTFSVLCCPLSIILLLFCLKCCR